MGRVLLAHDPVLDRDVALKHLRDDLQIPEDVRDGLIVRMRHEARAAARVTHPNLVTLHDMGEDPDVGLFLVFEYVEGPNLKELILRGAVPPKRVARMARELGAALRFAHDAGVLHRDIKPENVILSATGAKLADFGIARIPDSTLTHRGGLLGTPAYSAPETFKHSEFSPESDQFSLAATLYEAVTGKRAFPGDDAVAVAAKIAHDEPERMARNLGLSSEVEDVLRRAMSKSPHERFESCETFGLELVGALTGIRAGRRDPPPSHPGLSQPPASVPPPSQPASVPPSRGLTASAPPSSTGVPSAPPLASVPKAPPTPEIPYGQRSAPPPPRKTWQMVVGAVVVLVTAALLVHTALLDSARTETAPPASSVAPTASEGVGIASPTPSSTPGSPPNPRARPTRVSPMAAPSGSADASPADAGATAPPPEAAGGAPAAPAPSPDGTGGAGARP